MQITTNFMVLLLCFVVKFSDAWICTCGRKFLLSCGNTKCLREASAHLKGGGMAILINQRRILVACKAGFTLQGSQSIYCNTCSDQLVKPLPQCLPTSRKHDSSRTNCITNATIPTSRTTTTTPETTTDQETMPDYIDLTSPSENFSESTTLVISMFVVILILALACLILVGYVCHLRRKMPRSARETATDDILFECPTFDTVRSVRGGQAEYTSHNSLYEGSK